MAWKLESDLSMIVAVDEGGGFAKGRTIPWSYTEDWNHFKEKTSGNVCIMGRGTYEDIAKRRAKKSPNFRVLLPGRESYVVSETLSGGEPPGTKGAFSSTRQILDKIHMDPTDPREIFILGGRRLYVQHLVSAKQIWMTIVPGYHNCNKRFPVEVIDKDYAITEGREENGLKFIRYGRKIIHFMVNAPSVQIFHQMLMHFQKTGVLVDNNPQTLSVTVTSLTDQELAEIASAGFPIRPLNKVA